jgi:hypothetical protein
MPEECAGLVAAVAQALTDPAFRAALLAAAACACGESRRRRRHEIALDLVRSAAERPASG